MTVQSLPFIILLMIFALPIPSSWGVETSPGAGDAVDTSNHFNSSPSEIPTEIPKWEFFTGSLGHFIAASMSGTVNLQLSVLGSGIGSSILVGVPNFSIGYLWNDFLELTFTPSFNLLIPLQAYYDQPTDGNTLISRWTAGAIYNFSSDFYHSSFIRLDQGIAIFKSGGYGSTTYLASLHYGKRFKVTKNLSYSPTFSFEYMPGTVPHPSLALTLTMIQFSIALD